MGLDFSLKNPLGKYETTVGFDSRGFLVLKSFQSNDASQASLNDQHKRRYDEALALLNFSRSSLGFLADYYGIEMSSKEDSAGTSLYLNVPPLGVLNDRFQKLGSKLKLAIFEGARFSPLQQFEALNSRDILFASDANVFAHDIMDHLIGWTLLPDEIIDIILTKNSTLDNEKKMTDFADAIDYVTSKLLSIGNMSDGEIKIFIKNDILPRISDEQETDTAIEALITRIHTFKQNLI